MRKILTAILTIFISIANAQQFKNIKLNLSGTISNGMVLRYDVVTDTWFPTATIPSGSASYIWTSTTVQSGANFWISGNGKANILRAVSNSGTQGGTGGFNWAAANDSLYWTARITGVPTGTQGGYGLQFTAYGANVAQTNPLSLSRNGDVTFEGANLFLTNTTSNLINFPAVALGAPTVSTRSLGTKLLLYPGISATSIDYALGVESGALWFSTASVGSNFKWYAAAANIMTLEGGGNLLLPTGSLGINVSTPAAKLDVQGLSRFGVGQMIQGRVFIDSTGAGVGTWVEHGRPEPQVVTTTQSLGSTYRRTLAQPTSDITLTLPNSPPGRTYVIKKAINNATVITIIPASGTIDGAASYSLSTSWQTLIFFTDGTNWFVE